MGMAESDGDSVPYSDRLAIVISGNKIGQRFDYTDCFFVQKLVNTANNLYFTHFTGLCYNELNNYLTLDIVILSSLWVTDVLVNEAHQSTITTRERWHVGCRTEHLFFLRFRLRFYLNLFLFRLGWFNFLNNGLVNFYHILGDII